MDHELLTDLYHSAGQAVPSLQVIYGYSVFLSNLAEVVSALDRVCHFFA